MLNLFRGVGWEEKMVVWGKALGRPPACSCGLHACLETGWSTLSQEGNGLCTALPESCTPQACSPQTPECCVCAKREDEHCTWTHLKEGLCPCVPQNLPQSIGFLDFHSVGFLSFHVKWVSRMRRKTAMLDVSANCLSRLMTTFAIWQLSFLFIRIIVFFLTEDNHAMHVTCTARPPPWAEVPLSVSRHLVYLYRMHLYASLPFSFRVIWVTRINEKWESSCFQATILY